MTEIHYSLPSNTLSHLVLAGLLSLQSLPVIAQQSTLDNHTGSVIGAAYLSESNGATYSQLSGPFAGEYKYAALKFEQPWMTSELSDFLHNSPQISLVALDRLLAAIRDTYGDVQIDTVMHTDPEEGWQKPVFIIHSGVDDFDVLMEVEDSFFVKASSDSVLLSILPLVVLMQA